MPGGDVIILNMSEPANASDLELLARYTRQHAEDAFATLVRRHVDLVHSAALRQVRSPQLAEEVAQTTFTKLARIAPQLAPDTILTAWLYQVTRREAIDAVRREARRQLREQIATELNTMNAITSDWAHIEPILDEAMAELDDTDRAAVLLRYFENKSLREVGATLGTSDDAAQKRVSRAVERLRELFAKRGITVGTSGLVVVISANAVQAAPMGLAITISTAAALAGTTLATATTATAIKTIAMTTLQKTVITATLAIVAGAGIYQASQAARLRGEIHVAKNNQSEYLQKLQRERDDASNHVAWLTDELAKGKSNNLELLRLRGEVGLLRNKIREQETLLAALPNQRQLKPIPAGYISKESLTFAGYSTPEKAMQSWLWAMTTGDKTNVLSSVGPNMGKEMGAEFATKSDGEFADKVRSEFSVLFAFQFVDRISVTDSEVDLTMSAITFGDQTNNMKMIVRRIEDDWKVDGDVQSRNRTAETPSALEMAFRERGFSNVTIRVHNKGQSLPPPTQPPPTEK